MPAGPSLVLLLLPVALLVAMLILGVRLVLIPFRRHRSARLWSWAIPTACLTIVVMMGVYRLSFDIAMVQTRDLIASLEAELDHAGAHARWPCGTEFSCSWSAGLPPATYDVWLLRMDNEPREALYIASIQTGMVGTGFEVSLSSTGTLRARIPNTGQALDPETLEPIAAPRQR
ncbi:MAG: hypothetical protein AB7I04_05965 [Pseudomonadales bacterium]